MQGLSAEPRELMSALAHEPTWRSVGVMTAFPLQADTAQCPNVVGLGPTADITSITASGHPSVHARLGRERLDVVGHRLQLHRSVVNAGLAFVVYPDRR